MQPSQPETLTGAQIIVRLLERQGITQLSGIPGGAILPLYDALAQSHQIEHILARHEQGAGFIAHGMARASGETAVCLATSGPGAANLLTAIADAKLDSIPLVAITGQVSTALIGTDAFQEIDTISLAKPITKRCFLVRSAQELLRVVPLAFELANSGRPGPVLIDVPKDIQLQKTTVTTWPEPGCPHQSPDFSDHSLSLAATLINEAKRPVLYLGGGVVHSGASAELLALVEKNTIPFAMTLMGLGALPVTHPLSLGMLGMHGSQSTNRIMHECDLLIAAGVRFDDRATGKVAEFCPHAKIIHIDIDPTEIGKIKMPLLGIRGDLKAVIERLIPEVHTNQRLGWHDKIDALKNAYPIQRPGIEDPKTPFGLIKAVADCLDDEALIVTDVGQHQMWVAQSYPLARPRQWLTSGGLGTMGFGLPTAIGAALSQPEQTVVCFSGDGSILMNIQELATAAENNANVKLIVMNNASLGMVVQQQEMFYKQRFIASRFSGGHNFMHIASAFGWQAFDLDECASAEETISVLSNALSLNGPVFIHAGITGREQVLPIVAPGAGNLEMLGE